jgi:hypothetical protein
MRTQVTGDPQGHGLTTSFEEAVKSGK